MDYDSQILREYEKALGGDKTLTPRQKQKIVKAIVVGGMKLDLDNTVLFTDVPIADCVVRQMPQGRVFI